MKKFLLLSLLIAITTTYLVNKSEDKIQEMETTGKIIKINKTVNIDKQNIKKEPQTPEIKVEEIENKEEEAEEDKAQDSELETELRTLFNEELEKNCVHSEYECIKQYHNDSRLSWYRVDIWLKQGKFEYSQLIELYGLVDRKDKVRITIERGLMDQKDMSEEEIKAILRLKQYELSSMLGYFIDSEILEKIKKDLKDEELEAKNPKED